MRRSATRANGPRRTADRAATRTGLAALRRPLPVAIAASAVAVLAFTGWQVRWPAALFGRQPAAGQPAAVAGIRSPAAPSLRPSGSTAAAGQATPAAAAPAGAAGPGSSASPADAGGATAPQVSGPAATVRAYIAAINSQHYATAWRLGGRNIGVSFGSFVSGFAGTARDVLQVLSVAGDVVTARLTAHQADGTVKTFTGTYAVNGHVITKFDVQQVS